MDGYMLYKGSNKLTNTNKLFRHSDLAPLIDNVYSSRMWSACSMRLETLLISACKPEINHWLRLARICQPSTVIPAR